MSSVEPSPVLLVIGSNRDEEYIEWLGNQWSFIFQKIIGMQRWFQYRQQLNLIAPLSYYMVTTLSGLQTLGEEYTSLIQIDGSNKIGFRVPSKLRRVIMIGINCIYPLITGTIIPKLMRNSEEWEKDSVLFMMEKLQHINLILFYIFGSFYQFSKRISNIKYATHTQLTEDYRRFYRLLGILSTLEFGLSMMITYRIKKYEKEKVNQQNLQSIEGSPNGVRCSLCWSTRKETTSTPCGHLFCWTCICQWIEIKKFCPICRTQIDSGSKLVYLHNY
ncbi:peroxisome biogenesis factor 10-like [Panonychus citri]|uniref:peroxisome biogenesis factor 10-like n=1 Tax=Panonychus citri TaxID=50023 RepID=UPI0023077948|nr:peroxisome biogenesis factor 10-like [Panonychus citri]XP_053208871.1 peroxisome biogenesis factor 10-like [Panonychus citri]